MSGGRSRIGGRVSARKKLPLGFGTSTSPNGMRCNHRIHMSLELERGNLRRSQEADEGSDTLRARLRENYTPLQAFCIMLFCLVSALCMATIAVTKRESNSWKWAFLQLGGLTALALMLTTIVYQVGSLLGAGTS